MSEKGRENSPRESKKETGCCRVEAVVAIDDRGQMVLPKEIRERAKISPGDKLAVMIWEKEGRVCCISLMKIEEFEDMARNLLAPMMREIISEKKQ